MRNHRAMAKRVCVVGNSGSGKTRMARLIAARLDLPYLELDALNHRPGWQEAPLEEFRDEVRRVATEYQESHGGWVVDGNYRSRVADLLADADTYVWLDYPRRVVMFRVVRRTLGRVALRRQLWNGNRESWRFIVNWNPETNIIMWSWTQHSACRLQYETAAAQGDKRAWVRLRNPKEAEAWLAALTSAQ